MSRKPAPPTYFVFDVESIGLYGEGFAVGFVVVDLEGNVQSVGFHGTDPANADGAPTDRSWVSEHVLPAVRHRQMTCENPSEVRSRFFDDMRKALRAGAQLWGDAVYPVESTFLRLTLEERLGGKLDAASSPVLRDVAPVALLLGIEDAPSRVPHDPVEDARASAATLLCAVSAIRAMGGG